MEEITVGNAVVRRSIRRAAGLLGAVLTIGVCTCPAATSASADNGSWWVQPAPQPGAATSARQYFILEGHPGTTLQDGLAISNYTDHPITYYVYGADGYNTPKDGQFAVRDHGYPMTGVGSWVRTAFPTVTVPARTSTVVPVTVTIPADATPGDHVGGVSGMDTAVESVHQQGNVQVGIKRVVAARLYLHVDGAAVGGLTVTGLKVSGSAPFPAYLGDGDGTVTASITNSGNLVQTPKAHLRATGIFGTLIDKTVQLPQILPGQSIDFAQKWKHLPPFEIGTVHLDVSDGSGSPAVTSTAAASLILIPWLTGLVVVLIAVVTITGYVMWQRRKVLPPVRHDSLKAAAR
ncbi:MAG: WxL protein peptidoglycan domain-containing protein [Catenulispora sp.]